jgi:type IV pilus assembly protein PilM
MTVSGQAVFPRFIKLPPVAREKIFQIVQYEAEQNVPFPIDEVVWDYELTGSGEGELNVMLVAVKVENIRSLTDCVIAAGMEPQIVDVAPMALYNTVRYNYPSLEGCTMILDIGARSSNLVFMEDDRIFSRSIPVAGNAITRELANEFDLPFDKAEELKLEHAFVAFGGVYAGPDSEVADRVSKIVRNVVTRLHAEVSRSINFYRSQHGGSPPLRVLLTGGSSIIPHTDTFFREKLKATVEYLNPFANVAVSSNIDTERIGKDVQVLGEVVGLALRGSLTCPIEINLMPPELVAKKEFRKRQPFFALAAIGIVLILLCWWVYSFRMNGVLKTQLAIVEERIENLKSTQGRLNMIEKKNVDASLRATCLSDAVMTRTQWLKIAEAVYSCLFESMWLTDLEPVLEGDKVAGIRISGMGYQDKLDVIEKEIKKTDSGATVVGTFADRLSKVGMFGDIDVVGGSITTKEYLREFTIEARLVGRAEAE